jgi:hypothetical protein
LKKRVTCPDTHTREVSPVIRICYAELPCGLHVRTEAQDGQVTIWLQPGLTGAERRAALRRVRRTARMGLGPELPKTQYARALAADRLRTGAGRMIAVVRTRPVLLTPVIVAILAVAGYLFVASAPLRAHPELTGRGDRQSLASPPAIGAAGRDGPGRNAVRDRHGRNLQRHHPRRPARRGQAPRAGRGGIAPPHGILPAGHGITRRAGQVPGEAPSFSHAHGHGGLRQHGVRFSMLMPPAPPRPAGLTAAGRR